MWAGDLLVEVDLVAEDDVVGVEGLAVREADSFSQVDGVEASVSDAGGLGNRE